MARPAVVAALALLVSCLACSAMGEARTGPGRRLTVTQNIRFVHLFPGSTSYKISIDSIATSSVVAYGESSAVSLTFLVGSPVTVSLQNSAGTTVKTLSASPFAQDRNFVVAAPDGTNAVALYFLDTSGSSAIPAGKVRTLVYNFAFNSVFSASFGVSPVVVSKSLGQGDSLDLVLDDSCNSVTFAAVGGAVVHGSTLCLGKELDGAAILIAVHGTPASSFPYKVAYTPNNKSGAAGALPSLAALALAAVAILGLAPASA